MFKTGFSRSEEERKDLLKIYSKKMQIFAACGISEAAEIIGISMDEARKYYEELERVIVQLGWPKQYARYVYYDEDEEDNE